MKRVVYPIIFVILAAVLLMQGCDIIIYYDITVINDTDFGFSVYLDDVLQFRLAAGGISTIHELEEGRHTIDARESGKIIAEEVIHLDHDMEWMVYVATYEITVVNETRSFFSVYLDGIFQFDLESGRSRTLVGISEGEHTIDARVGRDTIASETFFVDQSIEWTVY